MLLAQSLVYGFIFATVVAWPIQSILKGLVGPNGCSFLLPTDCSDESWGNIPLAATYVALVVGLVFAARVYGLLHSLTCEARKRTRMDD